MKNTLIGDLFLTANQVVKIKRHLAELTCNDCTTYGWVVHCIFDADLVILTINFCFSYFEQVCVN